MDKKQAELQQQIEQQRPKDAAQALRETSKLLGVSVRTLQEWEQGRRAPSGAARSLLHIAAQRPDVFRDVLSVQPRT